MGTVRRAATLLALLIPLGACDASTKNVEVQSDDTEVQQVDTAEVRLPTTASVDACSPAASMLAALDVASGEPRWRYCAESATSLSVVAATNKIVYASLDGRLVAFDGDDGTLLWTIVVPYLNDGVETVALRAPGAFAGSGVIVLDILEGDQVQHIAYDARTGEELWRVAGSEDVVIANTDDLAVVADVYLGGGVGPEIGFVALDRLTGEERWRIDHGFTDLAGVAKIGQVLVIGQQSVAQTGPPGALELSSQVALDIDTGQVLWRGDPLIVALGSGAPSDLVVGLDWHRDETSMRLVAVDAATGTQRWASGAILLPSPQRMGSGGWQPAVFPQAMVDDSSAYLWHDGTLSRHDPASGDVKWEVPADGYLARFAAGHIVLVTDAETLTARAAADGHQEWNVTLPATEFLPSIVDNTTTFFVGTITGHNFTTPPGAISTPPQAPTSAQATVP
jgi:outer membrane protein assembly factor BamB